MTHTLWPYIRVCLILVKDIKLWWVPAFTSPLLSSAEDSAGLMRYVNLYLIADRKWLINAGQNVGTKLTQLHVPAKCFTSIWAIFATCDPQQKVTGESAGWRWKSTSRVGAEQRGSGTAEEGVGSSGWMYWQVTATEAGGGHHCTSSGSLLRVSL